MVKKVMLSIMVIGIMLFSINVVNAASGKADFKADKESIKAGETFTVTLFCECEDGINGIETSYNYDSSKLELISAEVANKNWVDMSGGRANIVEVICNTVETIKSDNIYVLTFKAKENQETTVATISTGDIKVDSDKSTSTFTEKAKTVTINIESDNQETPGNSNGNGNTDKNNGNTEGNSNSGTENNGTTNNKSNTANKNQASNSLANKILPKTGKEGNQIIVFIIAVASLFAVILFTANKFYMSK